MAVFAVAGVLGTVSPATAPETVTLRSEHLTLRIPAKERRRGERLLERADAAFQFVLDEMPLPFDERVDLLWCSTQEEFEEHAGRDQGQAVAVAAASIRRVYLNGARLRRAESRGVRETLIHEFVHIYLGRRIPGRIPLWLNEGLAMVVSEDWDMNDSIAIAGDGLFRRLYSPQDLAREFPPGATPKHRAYRQSRSMTAFLLEKRFPQSGVRGLVADLAQPSGRSVMRPLLFDSDWLDTFSERWRREEVRPGQLILVVTGSGTLWIALTFLLLFAYRKKRRARRHRESRWAWEEEFGYYDDGFDD